MDINKIGSFFAVTYDKRVIEINVHDNETMSVSDWALDEITHINMKPRVELYDIDGKRYIPCRYKTKDDLILQFVLSDELFNYLREKRMISYSTDMAYLYDLSDKRGFDYKRKGGRPFKWALKDPDYQILKKQKEGNFNRSI